MTIDEAIANYQGISNYLQHYVPDEEVQLQITNAKCIDWFTEVTEWLAELKDLREENKVLMQECDRLIKEKGELLSKVSGGDVLRICQLEEQIKDWKEEYAYINKSSYGYYKELKEAKRLLKAAVEDLEKIASVDECSFPYCDNRCPFECVGQCEEKHWKHKDEALKLIGEDGDT